MRKLGILFLWLVVLFFFFAGFYLFIVPSNKASVNKYGFHILEQLETAIQNKIDADLVTYGSNLEDIFNAGKDSVPERVKRRLNALGVDSLLDAPAAGTPGAGTKAGTEGTAAKEGDTVMSRKAKRAIGRQSIRGVLADIANGRLIYEFKLRQRTIVLTQPISRLTGDLEHSYPSDFYSAFIFLKCESGVATTLYKSDGVPIGLNIPTDSLLVNSKGAFYPGVTDLHTGGQDFKLFYIPLTKGKLQFALCGIKDADAYNQSLHHIPTSFVYPVVILLMLLAIALPLIKFYIIGPTEALRVRDLSGVALALLGGGMLVTLIIIQLILLKDGNARQQVALGNLSKALDSSFTRELRQAFGQLQRIDQRMSGDKNHWRGGRGAAGLGGASPGVPAMYNYDVSDSLVAFMQEQGAEPLPDRGYFNFDRVDWVDSLGMQVVSASLDTSQSRLRVDVANRQYFKDFSANNCYRLPGNDTSLVSVQAVITWTDGDFRVVLARRSSCPGMRIVTLSTHLYSVNDVVLPSGFGFCLIDPSGQVQVHSEPSRNLVENFLQQSDEPDQLMAAMTGRQELYLETTTLYGREYGLHLAPIAGMPFYLSVFYDKGYILPMNMRILVFALLGCAVILVSCAFLWLLFTRRVWLSRPLLFSPVEVLMSLRPDYGRSSAYFVAMRVIAGFTFLTTVVAVMNPYVRWVNKWVLLGLVLMPLLVMETLWIILWMVRRMKRRFSTAAQRRKDPGRGGSYVAGYSLLLESLVLCLGVTPAALFTWHAQNQEIQQFAKREQLLKAYQLTDRRNHLYQPLVHLHAGLPREAMYRWWMDSGGIYNIYGERMYRTYEDKLAAGRPFVFEQHYFDLAQRFGDINYDPSHVPVLLNHSADFHWKWMDLRPKDTLIFSFVQDPDVHQRGLGVEGRTAAEKPPMQTVIVSKLPERYPYLGFFWKSLALVVFVSALLVGLFKLIRRIVQEVFLLRWTYQWGPAVQEEPNGEGQEARMRLPAYDFQPPKGFRYGEPVHYGEPIRDDAARNTDPQGYLNHVSRELDWIARQLPQLLKLKADDEAERELVRSAQYCRDYFQWLFTMHLSQKEQWLLYHFARHGLLNYKNVEEMDHLLGIGVLKIREGGVWFFSPAFRAYILMNWRPDLLPKEALGRSAWQRFRIPFLILLTVVAAFLFLTQQEAWQRITALVGALGSALGAVLGLLKNFDNEKAP